PPAFVTRTVCPALVEIYPGVKFHAGCPMMFAARGENSSSMNSAKVVSFWCGVAAHVPGPTAALKVAGSQLSTIATVEPLLRSRAVPTSVQVTHKPTTKASPLAKIATFCMRLASTTASQPSDRLGLLARLGVQRSKRTTRFHKFQYADR